MNNGILEMLPRIRLHHILFIAFTLISSVPVLFLATWVQQSALNKEVAAVEEKHLLVARNLMGGLARYAIDTESVFKLVANNIESNQPLDDFRSILRTLYFKHVSVLTDYGEIKTSINPYNKKIIKRISAATLDTLEESLHLATLDPGKVVFSDLIGDSKGAPTIYLIRAISQDRYIIGALSTEYFNQVQKSISFGRRGHAAIVDKTGKAIAHPLTKWRESMKDMSLLPPVERMMQGDTGVSRFFSPAMQADMIAGYTSVPGVGWGVMVPQPFEELEERAADINAVAIGLTLLGITIAGLISWSFACLLAKPIEAVVQSARSIPHEQKIPAVTIKQRFIPHELRELMTSYNNMIEELQEKTGAIKETASRLAEAQRIAHIGNWEWDIDNNKLWCSEETYRIANIDAHHFNGKIESLINLVHPDDKQEFEKLIKHCEKYRNRFSFEHRLLHPDNSVRFVYHEAEMKQRNSHDKPVMIGIIHDITERKLYENKLFQQANYDELTGLPNRSLLVDRLTEACLFAKRNDKQVAVLFIDLDNFKMVNESYGHTVGDRLLKAVAKKLHSFIRLSDTLARLNGDEFAIILKEIKQESDAANIAEKLISLLDTPFTIDGINFFVSASIGITLYPRDSENTVKLLRNADIALFRAKDAGKKTYRIFSERSRSKESTVSLLPTGMRKVQEKN